MVEEYLAHHGILGMNWGKRHGPPYPLDKNSARQAALKRNSISDYPGGPAKKKASSGPRHTGRAYDPRAEVIAARKARQEAKAAKRAEREDERRQKSEAEKAKTLRSGSAKDVLKYQGQLSNQELSDALNRIRMERELGSIAEQTRKGKKVFNRLASMAGSYGDKMAKFNNAITQTKAFFKNFEDNKPNNTQSTSENKPNNKPNNTQSTSENKPNNKPNNTQSTPENKPSSKPSAENTKNTSRQTARTFDFQPSSGTYDAPKDKYRNEGPRDITLFDVNTTAGSYKMTKPDPFEFSTSGSYEAPKDKYQNKGSSGISLFDNVSTTSGSYTGEQKTNAVLNNAGGSAIKELKESVAVQNGEALVNAFIDSFVDSPKYWG